MNKKEFTKSSVNKKTAKNIDTDSPVDVNSGNVASVFIKSHEFLPTPDSITFSPIKWGTTGYGSIELHYNSNDLLIQTPKLRTPFGFSQGVPNTPSYGKDFNCQFNLDSTTLKNKSFYDSLMEFEKVILKYAFVHRSEWELFGNQTENERATLKDIQNKYVPMIKTAKDPRYPPSIKFNFRTKKNKDSNRIEISTECNDDKNGDIVPSETTIPRNSQCILIVSAKSIWVSVDRKFGIRWQIERIKVYPPEQSNFQESTSNLPSGTCLIESDSENDEADD